MEDIHSYRMDEENEDDRSEYTAASVEDEVPFHIPRD